MKERIAIINGVRTPFCKAGGVFSDLRADDLGAFAVKELLQRIPLSPNEIDELIFGNVLQPPHATNIARVVSVKGGLPEKVPAFTVNRNCASGMEAIVTASNKILQGGADIIIAGGCESMSQFPILFPHAMRAFLFRLSKAKTWKQKLSALLAFRPSLLMPDIPKIADPLCSLSMGQTAEILSRDFHVTREEQDAFALLSQERAINAMEKGLFAEEITPIPLPPQFNTMQIDDVGPRKDQTLEALAKLKPVFDKVTGSVTAGNSSQVTDGACCILLMKESLAKKKKLKPIGYIRAFADAALEPRRMGLGPVFATAKLLDQTKLKFTQFDLIEINEAFAAQVVAVTRAFASKEFAKNELNRKEAIGEIDPEQLNVNGGAVALGHPIGVSGTRIVLTLAKELKRRGKNLGLATLCVGGGQGEATVVEVD